MSKDIKIDENISIVEDEMNCDANIECTCENEGCCCENDCVTEESSNVSPEYNYYVSKEKDKCICGHDFEDCKCEEYKKIALIGAGLLVASVAGGIALGVKNKKKK